MYHLKILTPQGKEPMWGLYQLLSMSFRQFQKPQQLRTYCFNLSTHYNNLTPQSYMASKCHYLLPDSLGNYHLHLIKRAQFNDSISHCHLTPKENTTTELLKGVKCSLHLYISQSLGEERSTWPYKRIYLRS